jgi:hypothetical protein
MGNEGLDKIKIYAFSKKTNDQVSDPAELYGELPDSPENPRRNSVSSTGYGVQAFPQGASCTPQLSIDQL